MELTQLQKEVIENAIRTVETIYLREDLNPSERLLCEAVEKLLTEEKDW